MENSTAIKGAEYAREAVALTATNRNTKAREAMAKAAVRIGNYTPGGKAIWEEYIDAGCPCG